MDNVREYVHDTGEGLDLALDGDEIYEKSQGNPFFMKELVLEAVDKAGGIRRGRFLPGTIRETIKGHIELTSASTQKILSSAAVVGRSFSLSDLATMHPEIDKADLLDRIESAEKLGIVDAINTSEESFRFTHVLFQEYLESIVPSSVKAFLHKSYALNLLESLGERRSPEIMAAFRHLSKAATTEAISELPAVTYKTASYALEVHAIEEALAILDAGLEARSPREDDRAAWAKVLQFKGKVLFELRDPRGKECFMRAFDTFEQLGQFSEAVECAIAPIASSVFMGEIEYWQKIERGIAELIPRALGFVTPNTIQEKLLLVYGRPLEEIVSDYNAEQFIEDVAEEPGFDTQEFETHVRLRFAIGYFRMGRLDDYQKQERRAIELADKIKDEWLKRELNYFRFRHATVLGDLEVARNAAQDTRRLAAATQSRETISSALYLATRTSFFAGAWDESARDARKCVDLHHGTPRSLYHEYCLAILMTLAYERGDSSAGDDYKGQLLDIGGNSRTPYTFLAPLLARLTGTIDDLDKLNADLHAIPCTRDATYRFTEMERQVALAQLALWCDDLRTVSEMVQWFLPLKGRFMPATIAGRSADALLGALSQALGNTDDAIKHYRDSITFCRNRFIPELAWISYEYAKVLCGRGDQYDKKLSLEALGEGLKIAERLEMNPLIEKIDLLSRCLDDSLADLPDGLTEREVEVLLRVARGLTNQEIAETLFISPRTVAQHVQNILRKTGMGNRAAATAYAFRKRLIN